VPSSGTNLAHRAAEEISNMRRTQLRQLRNVFILAIAATVALTARAAEAACAGANPNDWNDDTAALQACLNNGDTIVLDPGSPGYIVNGTDTGDPNVPGNDRGLVISQAGTTITSSQAPTRATIIAGRDLFAHILRATPFGGVANITITYISFDGMVDDVWEDGPYRRHRAACTDPSPPERVPGVEYNPGNLHLESSNLTFTNNESKEALCGSGLGLYGTFNVQNNYIAHNGRDKYVGTGEGTPWSDGMTVLYCNGGYIAHNTLVDNTDIGIALGGGPNCVVELNTIAQFGKYAWAGLNVGNFDAGPDPGNHAGSSYRGNSIYSGVIDRLAMGILIGSHPWSTAKNVSNAGSVTGNTSHDNVINMVIDAAQAGDVSGNSMYNAAGSDGKGSCTFSADYTVNTNDVGFTPQSGWVFLQYHNDSCSQ
jgi:hypothetical protein